MVAPAITDATDLPVDTVIPLRVNISDPNGRPAEYSGYYGAATGQLDLTLDLATNDTPGVWTIEVQELVTGLNTARYVRVVPQVQT